MITAQGVFTTPHALLAPFGVNPTPIEKGGVIATPLLYTFRMNVQKQYIVKLDLITEKHCSGLMLMLPRKSMFYDSEAGQMHSSVRLVHFTHLYTSCVCSCKRLCMAYTWFPKEQKFLNVL